MQVHALNLGRVGLVRMETHLAHLGVGLNIAYDFGNGAVLVFRHAGFHNVGQDLFVGMLGRVIDPLGEPLDGKGLIGGELYDMPLERKAPGVIYRQPVNQPLQTGLKAVDAMIPIHSEILHLWQNWRRQIKSK